MTLSDISKKHFIRKISSFPTIVTLTALLVALGGLALDENATSSNSSASHYLPK